MILPGKADRFLVLGPTGCGKSQLVRDMLKRVRDGNITNLIVDFKGDWKTTAQDRVATSLRELERALDKSLDDGLDVVYRVPKEHLLRANSGELDKVAFLALQRTFTRVYYDELKYVANGTDWEQRAPNYYYAVTTGRSKFVPVWAAVQRPAWVPKVALSESDVRASFYLRMRADRGIAEELCGENVPWNVLRRERYSFIVASDMAASKPQRIALGKVA